MSAKPIESVLIVDAQPITRMGIRAALTMTDRWHICGEAEAASTVLALAEKFRPALCVFDIVWPRADGMALLHDLIRATPLIRIVVFTSLGDADTVRRTFRTRSLGLRSKR
jgi:DNA-binding NarL/FixJ family response regulator